MDKDKISHKAFDLIKIHKNISVVCLCEIINKDQDQWESMMFYINKLFDNYKLVTLYDGILSLTEKGEKHETLDSYLKSLKKSVEREDKQDRILDLELKLKTFESKIGRKLIIAGFVITFLSFLITALTLEFWKNDEYNNEQKKPIKTLLLNTKQKKDSLN